MNSDNIVLIYLNSILLLANSSHGVPQVQRMSRSLLFHHAKDNSTNNCDFYETCADCEMLGLKNLCNWNKGVCVKGTRKFTKYDHCVSIHHIYPASVRQGDRFHIVIRGYSVNKAIDYVEVRLGGKICVDLKIGAGGLTITCTANTEPGEQPIILEITRKNDPSAKSLIAYSQLTVEDDDGLTQFLIIGVAIILVIFLGLVSFVIFWFLRYTNLSAESMRSVEGIRTMMPLPFRRRFDTNKRNLSKYSVQKTDSLHVPEPRNVSAISEQFKHNFDQDSTRSAYDGYG